MRQLECENCHTVNHVKMPAQSNLNLWGIVICYQCGSNVRVARIGDRVKFQDEFKEYQIGQVSRIVPRGEYSDNREALAIITLQAIGAYVRLPEDVTILTKSAAEEAAK